MTAILTGRGPLVMVVVVSQVMHCCTFALSTLAVVRPIARQNFRVEKETFCCERMRMGAVHSISPIRTLWVKFFWRKDLSVVTGDEFPCIKRCGKNVQSSSLCGLFFDAVWQKKLFDLVQNWTLKPWPNNEWKQGRPPANLNLTRKFRVMCQSCKFEVEVVWKMAKFQLEKLWRETTGLPVASCFTTETVPSTPRQEDVRGRFGYWSRNFTSEAVSPSKGFVAPFHGPITEYTVTPAQTTSNNLELQKWTYLFTYIYLYQLW